MVVDYAVTVVVNGAGVTAEQLNYLTLQSNQVENSYREFEEHPTVVLTISEDNKIFIEDLDDKKLESGKMMCITASLLKDIP